MHALTRIRTLVFISALLPLGFAYVAMILCGRSTPFASHLDAWGDWLAVTLSGPMLYHLGGRACLGEFVSAKRGWVYGAGFFAGLHWEYIGRLTGAKFSLTAQDLTHLSGADRLMLAVAILVFSLVIAIASREANRHAVFRKWLGSFLLFIGLLAAITLYLGPHYRLHVHHYFWALCLIPWVRFPHPVCLIAQSILVGVYVEGASRWSLGAIWNAVPVTG